MPLDECTHVGEALQRLEDVRSVVDAQADVEVGRLQAAAQVILDEGEVREELLSLICLIRLHCLICHICLICPGRN
jgi:hypothetical protein